MFKKYILPYVVDWAFIFLLGILMALLSFAIDYLIEQLGKGISMLAMHVHKFIFTSQYWANIDHVCLMY